MKVIVEAIKWDLGRVQKEERANNKSPENVGKCRLYEAERRWIIQKERKARVGIQEIQENYGKE